MSRIDRRRDCRHDHCPPPLSTSPVAAATAAAAGASCTRSNVDERLAVVGQRPQLGVLRVAQIALRLDDEEVGGHADFELALLGLEPLFGQLARGHRRLDALQVALHRERGVGDLGGDLQLERAQPRLRLVALHARARVLRVGRRCRTML